MKIAILHKVPFEFIGVMHISSIIKKLGHQCEVFISDIDRAHLLENVRGYSPDLIAFSLMSSDYKWFKDTVSHLQNIFQDIPIIVGGPHATFFPELIESNDVKALFRGEAEGSIEEFIRNYDNEDKLKTIDGLWYKDRDGNIYKNKIRFLLQHLDKLPFPDRSIYYDKYKVLKTKTSKQFLTSRGCPYCCSFCYNKNYQKLYHDKGRYIRHFSQERIIQEIKETKEKYPLKSLDFVDDAFTQDSLWLMKFLPLYKKEVGLPFKCTVRADMMTDELAKALKDAGVNVVVFGIESGNEHIRNDILNKRIKDDAIVKCADMLKKNQIKFGTFNMFCIPSETINDAFKAVELNTRIQTDYPWSSILMPYPGTDIAKTAVQMKLLPENFDFTNLPASYFSSSPLRLDKKHVLENLQKVFYLAVKQPILFPVLKKLIRINCPLFFRLLFSLSFIYRFSNERNLPLWKSAKIIFRFRKSF